MEPYPLTINPAGVMELGDEELFRLCVANPDVDIERTSKGELVLMAPAGSESSRRNGELLAELALWNREERTGVVFDSSGGFRLPSGAMRAPDAAWVAAGRWAALSSAERETFAPLCPDFVAEVRSATDRLADLQAKMEEYRAAGCRLGWLIDPQSERVWIYRPGEAVREVEGFEGVLSGEDVLPGFELRLSLLR